MSRSSGSDPHLDPASGVLTNRLGITDEATLEQTEAALVATRSYELSRTPLRGRFDLAHLQAIHKYLFGDLYEWLRSLVLMTRWQPTKAPPCFARRRAILLG